MTKCQQRAKDWPGIWKDIDDKVSKCSMCCEKTMAVGTDLFEWKQTVVVDYYSPFIEIAKLTLTTAVSVITRLKSIFAHHGIPEIVVSDNVPQYSSAAFEEFSKDCEFDT